MSRFVRIRTVWRKELTDTLRDRRTLIAMVVVPILLYPALMLGSFQMFELQQSQAKTQEFQVGVADEETAAWLRARIDSDLSRRLQAAGVAAEDLPALKEELRDMSPDELLGDAELVPDDERKRTVAELRPYTFDVVVLPTAQEAVEPDKRRAALRDATLQQRVDVAVFVEGPLPTYATAGQAEITIFYDATVFSSVSHAAPGIEGVLTRLADAMVDVRLRQADINAELLAPIKLSAESVATPEQEAGFRLGMILPLILITMTISGAIYPAIDLTAGERERGTLETLMVAPVPTLDLISGKFLVVTLIGMLSATLNLLAMGGTMYFGGLGRAFTGDQAFTFPMSAIPLTLLVMIPMAVMFSAMLLAVCSFARSFKEAQNYVMPVLVAAMVPAIVGLLPGSRLDGPLVVVPVTNIVLLMRELFVGRVDAASLIVVTLSTSLYASAAVAIAARLFGQEAVLFSDGGSFKTITNRTFFKSRRSASTAQAFLLLAVAYLGNFFIQTQMQQSAFFQEQGRFFFGTAAVLIFVFGLLPLLAAWYSKVNLKTGFAFLRPRGRGLIAAICFGLSTWILAMAWFKTQQSFLPMPEEVRQAFAQIEALLAEVPVVWQIVLLALVPAVVEEVFFRGYALNGLKNGLGWTGAVLVTAIAFGLAHGSVHRLPITVALGIVLGLLVMRSGSLWPAIVAHLMHNGLSVSYASLEGFSSALAQFGAPTAAEGAWPVGWIIAAGAVALLGLFLTLSLPAPRRASSDLSTDLPAADAAPIRS